MQIHLHQTHHQIADFEKIGHTLKSTLVTSSQAENNAPGIHLFPELFLTGYPLQDLVLQRTFIEKYLDFLQELDSWSQSLSEEKSGTPKQHALVGGLSYEFDQDGLPQKIENVIFLLSPGKALQKVYTKILLPNYDIFDEEKYFSPGDKAQIIEIEGLHLGLLICEDMWVSSHHPLDPIDKLYQLVKKQNKLDAIINLSASPFHIGKKEKREHRGAEISKLFNVPFYYVNRVGGEDEILFDGGSFVIEQGKLTHTGKLFEADHLITSFQPSEFKLSSLENPEIENTWEDLFSPNLDFKTTPPLLNSLNTEDLQVLLSSLTFGLQEYTQKCGFKKFLVALSGGIDSSLVLALAKLSLQEGQELEAIFMPSKFSSTESYDLSAEICQNLGVPLKILPIKFFHASIKNAFSDSLKQDLEGLADENIQSRLRGSLLYARSNQQGSMVINTSNKSEIAVGYSTLYGDSVGAISMLGDLYKSEVFELSKYINEKYQEEFPDGLIPKGIIERPPSAELRENQMDSQSLPEYERLDAMLEGLLSYRLGLKELHDLKFNETEIEKVYGLYTKSEYKRNQFCPIIKVRAKSFGFGYRVPISKKNF